MKSTFSIRPAEWACLLLGLSLSGLAQSPRQGAVLTVIEENDLIVNTDRHYTQGIKISYLHTDDYLPFASDKLYEWLPQIGFASEFGKFGYSIGQNIYTPGDISSAQPLLDDRPYAGWLYGGAILQRRGTSFGGRPTQEDFEFEFGIIGPSSDAEHAQTWVHEVRGFDLPQGWDNQLGNEPGLRLKYWRGVRLLAKESSPFALDFTPHGGLSLGNVETSARLGARVRVGVHLPNDFGIQTIDSLATTSGGVSTADPHRWGAYLFAGTEGRVVLHNAFLDGNLFRHSQNVDKEILAGDLMMGFVVVLNRVEIGYTQFYRTPEFHGQVEHDSFGAVFLKIKF